MIRTPAPVIGHSAPRGPTSEQLRARALEPVAAAEAPRAARRSPAMAPPHPTPPGWGRP